MKKLNSTSEFSSHRSEVLLNNFRKALAVQSVISAKRAFGMAADAPAPRFWVSEARATAVISKMMTGVDVTADMYPEKAEMYREIFSRVVKLREEQPEAPLGDLVFEVVNDPAPKSYLSWQRAKAIINERKRGRR